MADATVKIDLDAGGVNAGLERLKASALALDVATKRLEATWEDAGDAFEEGAQKLLDARNRADEFGASIGQQRAVVEAATRAAERYNKPLAITARFMEELVIETQDATKAVSHLDRAMAFQARTNLRVEDAVAKYTETLSGGTGALREFGDRGGAMAAAIDRISDPAKRATAAQAALSQMVVGSTGPVSALSSRIEDASIKLDVWKARMGPLGPALLNLGAAAAAAAIAISVAFAASVAESRARVIEASAALAEYGGEAEKITRAQAELDGRVQSTTDRWDKYVFKATGATDSIRAQEAALRLATEALDGWLAHDPAASTIAALPGSLLRGAEAAVLFVDDLVHLDEKARQLGADSVPALDDAISGLTDRMRAAWGSTRDLRSELRFLGSQAVGNVVALGESLFGQARAGLAKSKGRGGGGGGRGGGRKTSPTAAFEEALSAGVFFHGPAYGQPEKKPAAEAKPANDFGFAQADVALSRLAAFDVAAAQAEAQAKRIEGAFRDLGQAIGQELGGAFTSLAGSMAQAFGAMAAGNLTLSGLGDVARSAAADLAATFGNLFISTGAGMIFLDPLAGAGLIAAGIGLNVLSGAIGSGGGGKSSAGSSGAGSGAAVARAARSFERPAAAQEQVRPQILMIDGRAFTGHLVSTVSDARRRGVI